MSKLKMPPSTLLAPIPAVMVSCGNKEEGTDIVTIAWTGIINSHPAKTYVSVRPERYSYELIKSKNERIVVEPGSFTKGTFAEFKQFLRQKRPDLLIPE